MTGQYPQNSTRSNHQTIKPDPSSTSSATPPPTGTHILMTASATAAASRIDNSLDGGYWSSPAPSSRRASRSSAMAQSHNPAVESAEKPSSRSTGSKMAAGDSISAAGWAVLVVTYFAYVSMYCARKPFSVVKSTVQKEQGISPQELANIDTALLTAYAAGQLSLGLIVTLCGGRKKALCLAFLLAGAATAAFGAADTSGPMIGAWALAGLFAAPASPLFSILVGESVPEKVRLCSPVCPARATHSLRAVLPLPKPWATADVTM